MILTTTSEKLDARGTLPNLMSLYSKLSLKPKRSLYSPLFLFNFTLLILLVFHFMLETTEASHINKHKRESNEALPSNGGRRLNIRKGPRFGQLVVLAQEETKCLKRFGGQHFYPNPSTSPFITEDFYNPYICGKSSKFNAQCDICRNLTTRIRTLEECSLYCIGKQDEFCQDLCSQINKAVSLNWKEIEENSTFFVAPNIFNSTKAEFLPGERKESLFSQIPQVFCEGVFNPGEDSLSVTSTMRPEEEETSGNHFVVLKWNFVQKPTEEIEPIVFVIEKYSKANGKWEGLGKTTYNQQTINVTFWSETFKWRVSAVGRTGILGQVTSKEYVTLNGYLKPGPPKKIHVVKKIPVNSNNSLVHVLIGWDPPEEKACFYKISLETMEGDENLIRIKEPLGVHHQWFNLLVDTIYSILITSRDPSWDQQYESNSTTFQFRTPSCLRLHNFRFDKCAPPPPREIHAEILKPHRDSKAVTVHLSWKPPQNTTKANAILYYNISISKVNYTMGTSSSQHIPITSPDAINKALNGSFAYLNFSGNNFSKHLRQNSNSAYLNSTKVAGNTTRLLLSGLESHRDYHVSIYAISYKGSSVAALYHLQTDFIAPYDDKPSPINNWFYLVIPVCAMMLIFFLCNMGRIYLHKRQVKIARNQYFQTIEERDALSADWSIVPLTEETSTWKLFGENFPKEKWEILYENLAMGEVIGQGAFGIVRKAKISRKKLQPSTIKYLDKQPKLLSEEPDLETVAVKMLKVSATREDREQLVKEIMTMQNLGFHPQIVGLIGACTRGRSLSLVLEYCPGGDLLTFIRKVRAKYWPTLGLAQAPEQRTGSCSSTGFLENGLRRSSNLGFGKIKNSQESEEDNSPINYADLEHSSDCSSSSKSTTTNNDQGGPLCSPQQEDSRSSISRKNFPLENNGNGQEEEDEEDFRPIDERDVLSYARQIAMGMEYLERNRIVHRDLACRNCLLVGDYKQIKLSDFGLSRDVYTWNVYHQKSNGKLPIKWMAIESIFTHVFTSKSDIWSYGIILWELVTLGGNPYPGLGNTELFHLLKTGYRMERPDNSSEELYALMKKCWRTSPSARPTFTELKNYVQDMMEAAEPNLYLSLMADIPTDYYRLSSRNDLMQIQENTDGSLDFYNNSISSNSNRQRNSKKYSGAGLPPRAPTSTTTTSSLGPSDLQNSAKYTNISSSRTPEIDKPSSLTMTSPTVGDSKLSLVLENKGGNESPSVSSSSRADNCLKISSSNESGIEIMSSNNNLVSESNLVCDSSPSKTNLFEDIPLMKIPKSVSVSSVRVTEELGRSMRKSPSGDFLSSSSSLQYPLSFKRANDMTIIENKSYDLA